MNYIHNHSMTACSICQFSDQLLGESVSCDYHKIQKDYSRTWHEITTVYRWSHFPQSEHRFFHEHFLPSAVSFPKRYLIQNDPGSKQAIFFLILTLLITPVSCAAFTTETVVTPDSRSQEMETSCHSHFAHRVDACVYPFLSRLDVTYLRKENLKDSITDLTKHVCLEYQLVLLCLHSALTDCPNLSHIKLVQSTLGSHWAVRVNRFCSIPTQISTPSSQNYNKDLNYLQKPLSQNLNQLSQGIVQNLLPTSAQNKQNVASSSKPDGDESTSLANSDTHSQRERSGIERPSNGGSHDLNINIFNFVNNYQYDRSRVQHETERSRPSLAHVKWVMSTGRVSKANVYLVIALLCLIFSFNKRGTC